MQPSWDRRTRGRDARWLEATPLATEYVHAALGEQPRPAKLWHNTDFLRLWPGQTVSSVGGGIVKLAAPLLVLALTDSPAIAGLVTGALTFPMIFLGRPAVAC